MPVAGAGDGHGAARHRPAVHALVEQLPDTLLDGAGKGRGHRPGLDAQPQQEAGPTGAGATSSPRVARKGSMSVAMTSCAAPVPTTRSTQMGVVSQKRTSTS